jgi:hypothetical protein
MNFPFREYNVDDLIQEYDKLVKFSTTQMPNINKLHRGRIGFKCSNAFFQFERMNIPSQSKVSCIDFWDKNREKIIKYYNKQTEKDMFGIIQFMNHPPSQFPPSIAIQVYIKMQAKQVLDPFAGWGDRCLSAMALGIDYTGIDSNINLKTPFTDMISFYNHKSSINMLYQQCQDVDFDNIEFDTVLTSPPFWNKNKICLELYSHFTDTDYELFMEKVMMPVFLKCIRKAKWTCLYIPEDMATDLLQKTGIRWTKEFCFTTRGNKINRNDIIYCYANL